MTASHALRRLVVLRRNRCGVLLAALLLFILANPLLSGTLAGALLLNLWVLATLVVAVWALRVRGPILAGIGLLALVTFLGIATDQALGARWLRPLELAGAALFMGVVTAELLRYVLNFQRITTDKLFGAVATYVLIAFTFATLFAFVEGLQPGFFYVSPGAHHRPGPLAWVDLMYLSFTVLTSTGFGEITPVTDMARALIVIEQVLGVMYVAFLIARLANLYDQRRIRDKDD